MAEVKIQKAIVGNSQLPDLSSDGLYYVRYRVVSEDRNRVSHWSPVHAIDPNYTFVSSGNLSVEKVTGHVLIIWNPVNILSGTTFIKKATRYDVWLRWHRSDNGDWQYFERVEGNNLTILPPSTYTINGAVQSSAPNRLDVEIHLAGTPIQRASTFLRVYSKADTTI